MTDLRQKLNDRMDKLQSWMESNYHLQNPDEVVELINSISFAWRVLSDEDRDYIQSCQYAIERGIEWNI
jgi:predicted type IV restriction endonuclease